MERFYRENNGRPIYNNDFALLQNELLEATKASYKNRGAFIQNGVTVSGSGPYNISAGVVFIDNEPMRFLGVTGITFPYYIYQNAVQLTNYDEYVDNVSRPTRQLIQAIGGTSMPGSGEYITMTTAGGRPQAEAFATEYVRTVGTQTVAGNKILSGNNTHSGANTFTGSTSFTKAGPPFNVSSTTVVANLNADTVDGLDGSQLALKSVSITGENGLYGGGDISTNRAIGITTLGVQNHMLANGSVTVNKLGSDVMSYIIPTGLIMLWHGLVGSIPSGWYLCNGGNGTPNLVNRFIVAAGSSYGVGATGGSDNITLGLAQMPYHNHTMNTAGSHQHYVKEVDSGDEGNSGVDQSVGNYSDGGTAKYTNYAGDHTHSINYAGGSGGVTQPFDNRPLYYALCYIMKG